MLLAHTLTGQSAPVLSCAYSADGQMLVSGSVMHTYFVAYFSNIENDKL